MNRTSKYLMILLCLVWVSCEKESLKYEEGELPQISSTECHQQEMSLSIAALLADNGGSQIQEVGICYNYKEQGTPEHANEKSKILIGSLVDGKIQVTLPLMPRRNYVLRAYAQNGVGIAYGEVIEQQTGDADLAYYLEGTYLAQTHQSYMSPSVYDSYEVTVYKNQDQFYLKGLGTTPKEWPLESVDLLFTFSKTPEVKNDTLIYALTIPKQLTKIAVDRITNNDTIRYPLMMMSAKWLLDDSSDDQNIVGHVYLTDHVEFNLESGYGFVYSDPITHEILLSNEFYPKEVVMGPKTYPTYGDPDIEALVPRPACKLIKK